MQANYSMNLTVRWVSRGIDVLGGRSQKVISALITANVHQRSGATILGLRSMVLGMYKNSG